METNRPKRSFGEARQKGGSFHWKGTAEKKLFFLADFRAADIYSYSEQKPGKSG